MSSKRFTVNPSNELALTAEDRAKLVELVDRLALFSFEEYEKHRNNDKRVDLARCKTVYRSGVTTVYSERKKLNPHSNLLKTLMVGQLHGTLDKNMFGLVSPTLASMRIEASYLNDLSAAAVLATIVESTAEDPFRAIVVEWMEANIPIASVGIVRNRDYVVVERTGLLDLKNGERMDYHLFYSVSFRKPTSY